MNRETHMESASKPRLRLALANMRPARFQNGSSMIEVLVAILLVSVGLLGIAGLSGATFSYNKASQIRLTGLALVNDYADRARINVYGYDQFLYDIDLTDEAASTEVTVPDANLNLDPSVAGNSLTVASDLAGSDVDQFLQAVSRRLPQGKAVVISRPTAAARDMDIWLLWKEPKTDATDTLFGAVFGAGQGNCPGNLSTADKLEYSCMYFKVGL